MSFMLTTEQVRNRTKTVTRRLGWKFLKPGQYLWAVEKAQGLKKGEKVKRLALIRVYWVIEEPLSSILYYPSDESAKEGFPNWSNREFFDFFMKESGCAPDSLVTRIEFQYVNVDPPFSIDSADIDWRDEIKFTESWYQKTGVLEIDPLPF